MCRGIEKWVESATRKAMREGEKRGKIKGKIEGKIEGRIELLQSIILRMLSQARPVTDIIAMTGADIAIIQAVAKQNNIALL